MPRRALAPCTIPGCPEVVTGGKCERHARQSDLARGGARARGYTRAWEERRAAYLHVHPYCQAPGCDRPATDVDHADGSGPHGNNAWANYRAYCHAHHSSKTVAADGGFGRAPR